MYIIIQIQMRSHAEVRNKQRKKQKRIVETGKRESEKISE